MAKKIKMIVGDAILNGAQTVINVAQGMVNCLSARLVESSRDAISTERKYDTIKLAKWAHCGRIVREEYAALSDFMTVRALYLDVVYAALGDECARVMKSDIVRSNSKDYIGASDHQRQVWDDQKKAKAKFTAVGMTMFNRVCEYAFPDEVAAIKAAKKAKSDGEGEGEGEGKGDAVSLIATANYVSERLTQSIKRMQKDEIALPNARKIIEALTTVLGLIHTHTK